MRALEPWHLVVLVVLIGVLFGGKRLPGAARGLGQSMRIFKTEMRQMQDDAPPAKGTPSAPEPLEGRVVDGDPGRATAPTDKRNDA